MAKLRFAELFAGEPSEQDAAVLPIEAARLAHLVHPIPTEKFLNELFLRQAVVISGCDTPKLTFVTLERIRWLLRKAEIAKPYGFGLDAHFRTSSVDELFNVRKDQVGHLLDAGATVCITNLNLVDDELGRLVGSLKEETGFFGRVGVNCYISPHGAGFGMHFDSKAILVLQLEGAKVWRYGRSPAVRFPRNAGRSLASKAVHQDAFPADSASENNCPAREGELDQVTLRPGDVLSLPAGTWHEACAEGFSLALTVTFQATDFASLILSIVAQDLRSMEQWRSGPPPVGKRISDTHPEVVLKYFESRISELQNTVNSLNPNDPRLWGAWDAVTDRK